jgi:hypothetical protein
MGEHRNQRVLSVELRRKWTEAMFITLCLRLEKSGTHLEGTTRNASLRVGGLHFCVGVSRLQHERGVFTPRSHNVCTFCVGPNHDE